MHRIKCDNNVPCQNCVNRGEPCNNKSPSERRTLPQAYREIDRLNQKVRELEAKLEEERNSSNARQLESLALSAFPTPPSLAEPPPTHDQGAASSYDSSKRTWDGVQASMGHSPEKTWYGPSSYIYFISRINGYLSSVFQQLHQRDDYIQLKSAAKAFATPDAVQDKDATAEQVTGAPEQAPQEDFLAPPQEEYFLNLFWQTHHAVFVVLDESHFKQHYKSLWGKPGRPRQPSALVDIVIALSMQYGTAATPRNVVTQPSSANVSRDDATIAGRLYYHRCHKLLAGELESPTIRTLQCQLLSVIYLCCASFQNMAHSMLSSATRTSVMLGLHMEPSKDLPVAQQEMRKRLWWSLYMFESKTSMKLGRPFCIDIRDTSCSLPADNHEIAQVAGSDFTPISEDVTWLTYNLHNIKLVMTARAVHTAFFEKYSDFHTGQAGSVIYDDPMALERYAGHLSTLIPRLEKYKDKVPDALKTKRRNKGETYSTDLSPLAMEPFEPLWLQRQRLVLELLYHNICMALYRSFIVFPSLDTLPSPETPISQSHATSAVRHALAVAHIMHQILSDTDLLNGIHEVFQWHWYSAITLVGYLFAYPDSSLTSVVRNAVDLSITGFEISGRNFATALSAATVLRDLAAKADLLSQRGWSNANQVLPPLNTTLDSQSSSHFTNGVHTMSTAGPAFEPMLDMMDLDMPYTVDWSNNLDMLYPVINDVPDGWGFTFN
ncbi:fungal-specific transcription factor domain-containing protein [Xylariomycetidae sp. FL2044]|nr:fungal-specific transcription factor domain-containing protein [Xylariomycetidae sp. FL2044]